MNHDTSSFMRMCDRIINSRWEPEYDLTCDLCEKETEDQYKLGDYVLCEECFEKEQQCE